MKVAKRVALKTVETKEVLPLDQYAVLDVVSKFLKKHQEKVKKTILPSCNPEKPLKTARWIFTYTKTENVERLDTDAIRADMGADWIKKYTRTDGVRESIKCVSLEGVDAQIRNLEITDALCDDLLKVLLKHAKG